MNVSLPFAPRTLRRMASVARWVGAVWLSTVVLPGCSCSDESGGPSNVGGATAGGTGSAQGSDGGASSSSGGGSGSEARTFVHPGLLHLEADFVRMRAKIDAAEEPWAGTWNTLINYEDTSLEQVPQPLETLIRGGEGENFLVLVDDLRAMYGLGLAWNITKDERYGDLAVEFLNAWSGRLKGISGNTDRYLASGLYAYQLANVAELLRSYSGWKEADRNAFRDMLVTLFYPLQSDWLKNHDGSCETHFWANWDMANLAGMLAIGVFADRPDIYEEALSFLHSGKGNGALESMIYYVHPGNMGQYQESGRDQGHSNLGVTLMGVIAKQAFHQGDDLFAWKNNRLLSAFEYIARYNVGEDVPYVPYGPNCVGVRQDVISDVGRGHKRRSWMLPLNHYRNRLGIATPWIEAKHADVGDEVWRWSNDELGWGSLTEALDPIEKGGAPQGLVAHLQGPGIVLSFWGSAGAESYAIERANTTDRVYAPLVTLGADQDLTYTDTTWEAQKTYEYRVRAIFPDAETSEWSKVAPADGGPILKLQLSFETASSEGVSKNDIDQSDGATLREGATLGPGHSGQALLLDGSGAYATIPKNFVEGLADFTIAAWIYVAEERTNTRLFDFGANDHRYLAFAPRNAAGESRFMMTKVSYFGEEGLSGTALPVGVWTHVAVTLAGSTATLYLNGSEAARNETMIFAPFHLGIENAWLGRSAYAGDPAFSGKIDDFRLYAGVLKASEIADLATP